jgi:hypothetical protein
MASLKMKSESPPGDWKYFQAETGLWIRDYLTADETAWAMSAHRAHRQLSRSTYQECLDDLYNQICERVGSDYCFGCEPGIKDYSQNLSGDQIVGFTKAFIKHIEGGLEFVSIEEATARAEICKKCHLNIPITGCAGCGMLSTFLNATLPDNRKFGLGICARCGCNMDIKVSCTDDVLTASNEGRQLKFPSWCWQNK